MYRTTIRNSIGIFSFAVLSACASRGLDERLAIGVDNCPPPNTLTCDRFAGENHNCTCERSDRLKDILDSY